MPCLSHRSMQVLIVTLGCLSYATTAYHRVCPSILFDNLAHSLNVSSEEIGIFGSMYFWPYAVTQPFIGLLVDIYEPGTVLGIALISSCIGSVIIGLSKSFLLCCVGRCLVGLGSGPVMVPVCKLFVGWLSQRGFVIYQGLVLIAGAAGGIIAQGPLAEIIKHVDWRYTFFVIALFTLFLAFPAFFIKSTPAKAGFNQFESILNSSSMESLEGMERKVTFSGSLQLLWKNTRLVLSNFYFWSLVLWDAFTPGVYYNFASMWGEPYLIDTFGYTKETAAFILVLLNLAWILGTPVMTILSEWWQTRKMIVAGTALLFFICSTAFYFLDDTTPKWLVIAMTFAFGLFGSAPVSVGVAMFKEQEKPERVGTALGYSNFFPFMTSSLCHVLTSKILHAVDYDRSDDQHSLRAYRIGLWIPTAVLGLVGFIGAAFSRETYQIKDQAQEVDGKYTDVEDSRK